MARMVKFLTSIKRWRRKFGPNPFQRRMGILAAAAKSAAQNLPSFAVAL